MLAMTFPENPLERRALAVAVAVSLAIHGLVLFVNKQKPKQGSPLPRIEASLARKPMPVEVPAVQPAEPPKKQAKTPNKQQARPKVMAIQQPSRSTVQSTPKWTVAEKAEMNDFLNELASEAKAKPKPTLAQRSLAMAREDARQMARQEKSELLTLERRPNSPEPDPFSLELYFEGLLKNLNRSSAYVKNDPRSRGVRTAAVQFRINPDGTLKSFVVLNAADQGEEIAFIKAVVDRAAPFSPFPPDLNRSAKSMAVRICILPSRGGGFGFSRAGDGQGC
jgi:hypothetical protein